MSKKLFLIIYFLAAAQLSAKTVFISEQNALDDFLAGRGVVATDIYAFSNELLQNITPEETAKLAGFVKKRNLTVAGTAYRDIILPLLIEVQLEKDAEKQLEKGRSVYYGVFGSSPSIFYPALGKFDEKSIPLISSAQYTSIVSTEGVITNITVSPSDLALVVSSEGVVTDILNSTSAAVSISAPAVDLKPYLGGMVQLLALTCVKRASAALAEYSSSTVFNPEIFDAASEELFLIEKPSWFENYVLKDADKKRESDLWFRASISNIYKLMGQEPPVEVLSPLWAALSNQADLAAQTTGQYLVFFADDADSVIISSCDLLGLGVYLANDSMAPDIKAGTLIVFDVFVATRSGETIDIYIDMNNKTGAGSTSFLPGHKGFADSASAWEYALSIGQAAADLYKYDLSGGAPGKIASFAVSEIEGGLSVSVPRRFINGDPKMWGYITAGFLDDGNIFDIIGAEPPVDDTVIQIPALREQ